MTNETIDKIKAHYEHAKRKHPKFCDRLCQITNSRAQTHLAYIRGLCESSLRKSDSRAYEILDCEVMEIWEAYTAGRLTDAKEECYDAIAVLLRMVDMIDAEQMKPESDDSDIEETIADLREVKR